MTIQQQVDEMQASRDYWKERAKAAEAKVTRARHVARTHRGVQPDLYDALSTALTYVPSQPVVSDTPAVGMMATHLRDRNLKPREVSRVTYSPDGKPMIYILIGGAEAGPFSASSYGYTEEA